ncbi:MAG: hypothetical protein J1F20_02415 [Muribaculaceae bacterium]|nr:hypothetical protein [Muribaculaceae bacterium]
MKKTILLALPLMALSALSMSGKELDSEGKANYLYIDNGGSDPTCVLMGSDNRGTVTVYMDNETADLNSFIMDFYLPEGFSIAKNARGVYMVTFNNGDDTKTYNHAATVGNNNGYYRIVGTSTSGATILTGDDWLMTVTLEADATVARDKVYTVEVKDIEFASQSNTVNPHYFPDMEFTIKFDVTDSVNDITTVKDDETKEIYDLQGRKLKEISQPGLYIVSGEKVYVK